MKALNKIRELANKQYNDADVSNMYSDAVKDVWEHISINTDWLHEQLTNAYMHGFEDGYCTAKEYPTDEFGNFITEK